MTGIIFVILQVLIMMFCTTTPAANALDTTQAETGLNLTISEILALFTFIGGLFGVWLDARLRIKSLEIKTKQNETIIKENKVENYSDMCEIKQILKENATTTRDELKNITKQVNSLHVMFAEKFGKS